MVLWNLLRWLGSGNIACRRRTCINPMIDLRLQLHGDSETGVDAHERRQGLSILASADHRHAARQRRASPPTSFAARDRSTRSNTFPRTFRGLGRLGFTASRSRRWGGAASAISSLRGDEGSLRASASVGLSYGAHSICVSTNPPQWQRRSETPLSRQADLERARRRLAMSRPGPVPTSSR